MHSLRQRFPVKARILYAVPKILFPDSCKELLKVHRMHRANLHLSHRKGAFETFQLYPQKTSGAENAIILFRFTKIFQRGNCFLTLLDLVQKQSRRRLDPSPKQLLKCSQDRIRIKISLKRAQAIFPLFKIDVYMIRISLLPQGAGSEFMTAG